MKLIIIIIIIITIIKSYSIIIMALEYPQKQMFHLCVLRHFVSRCKQVHRNF